MTGITSVAYGYVPLLNNITISTNFNYFSPITFQPDLCIPIPLILIFSVLLFSLLLFCNYKFYCQSVKKSKFLKKRENKGLLRHLILLTIFKSVIIGLIYLSTQQKCMAVRNPNKSVGKSYFLSIEYFGDTYNAMELQTKSLQEWYAMSKIKFKITKYFVNLYYCFQGI